MDITMDGNTAAVIIAGIFFGFFAFITWLGARK